MNKQQLVEEKLCKSCGEDTQCSSSGKCWCYSYDLATNVDQLELDYGDCVCEVCLSKERNN